MEKAKRQEDARLLWKITKEKMKAFIEEREQWFERLQDKWECSTEKWRKRGHTTVNETKIGTEKQTQDRFILSLKFL
jgi:hypothetical protein